MSTSIFRPVRPVSPAGPPMENLPLGFMKYFVRESISSSGTILRTTCSIRSLEITSLSTSGACWALSTTVSTRLGTP